MEDSGQTGEETQICLRVKCLGHHRAGSLFGPFLTMVTFIDIVIGRTAISKAVRLLQVPISCAESGITWLAKRRCRSGRDA